MAFKQIHDQLKFIAKNGNYADLMNTMALLCAYSRTYGTGRVPTVRKFRGGKEASAVAGLQMSMTAATDQTNALHDYNLARLDFYSLVATLNPGVYAEIEAAQYERLCIMATPGFPYDVTDCVGTVIGTAADLSELLTLWNGTKVDADKALCDTLSPYLIDSGVAGYLIMSIIQPDNTQIIYNAPAPVKHARVDEFNRNRDAIGNKETQVNPKSIANFSADNI